MAEENSNYVIGKPRKSYGYSGYTRTDTYIPTDNTEQVFAAGVDDTSPLHKHWQNGKYDSRCSCCYLGFAHSEAKHQASIEEALNA